MTETAVTQLRSVPGVVVTWRGDLQVGGLLDVGSSRSGVKGWDQSRELSLQDKVIVPRPPATAFGLILLLLLQDDRRSAIKL